MRSNGRWMNDYERDERRRAYGRVRHERLVAARALGTHTPEEWRALHDLFGGCVRCGISYEVLHGGAATKDHIVPISEGGCDCIANLQPVCRQCNSIGIGEDLRDSALPGWQLKFLFAMQGMDAVA